MMSPQEWGDARWISDGHDKDYRPSPYFRKDFEVRRNVKHAYAVIAAAGLYELSVNGSRIGDHFLDPMYTHFDKRVLSVMYDITPNLSEGENIIGVQLGNGWYNHQSTAVWSIKPRGVTALHLLCKYESSMPTEVSKLYRPIAAG